MSSYPIKTGRGSLNETGEPLAKRRRLSVDPSTTTLSNNVSNPPLKTERSPSPIIRLPQTTGAKFYPMPENCKKNAWGCQANRRNFMAACRAEMSAPGLRLIRKLWRPDGLVFDWESDMPIMPDTLKPPQNDLATQSFGRIPLSTKLTQPPSLPSSTPKAMPIGPTSIQAVTGYPTPAPEDSAGSTSAHLDHDARSYRSPSVEIPGLGNFRTPSPPQPASSSYHQTSLPAQAGPENSSRTMPTPPPPSPALSALPSSSKSIRIEDQNAVPSTTSTPSKDPTYSSACTDYGLPEDWPTKSDIDTMAAAALQYLEKYISAFDVKHHNLFFAYTLNATFSSRRVIRGALFNEPALLVHGCVDILRALSEMPFLVFRSNTTDIQYDIVHLGPRIGVMVTVDGRLHERVGSGFKKPIPFRWTFVLKEATSANPYEYWPLQAISHQMTIFDLS